MFKNILLFIAIISLTSSCFSGEDRLNYILTSITKLNSQKNEIIDNEQKAKRLFNDLQNFQSNRNDDVEKSKSRISEDSLMYLIESEFEEYYFQLLMNKTQLIVEKIKLNSDTISKITSNRVKKDFQGIKKQNDSLNFLFDLDKKVKLQLKFSEIQSRFFVKNLNNWVNDL